MKLAVKPEKANTSIKIMSDNPNVKLRVHDQLLEKKNNIKSGVILEERVATIIVIYTNPYEESSFQNTINGEVGILGGSWLSNEGYDGSVSVYGYAKFHYYTYKDGDDEYCKVNEYCGYYEIVDPKVTVTNPGIYVYCNGPTLDGDMVSNELRTFDLTEGTEYSYIPPWEDKFVHVTDITGHACKVTLTCHMGDTREWVHDWSVQKGLHDLM